MDLRVTHYTELSSNQYQSSALLVWRLMSYGSIEFLLKSIGLPKRDLIGKCYEVFSNLMSVIPMLETNQENKPVHVLFLLGVW